MVPITSDIMLMCRLEEKRRNALENSRFAHCALDYGNSAYTLNYDGVMRPRRTIRDQVLRPHPLLKHL